jgi:DNA-binding transcriptional MerR regulator
MALNDIRALLAVRDQPAQSCGKVNATLDLHLAQVRERIAQLRALERQLRGIRSLCGQTQAASDCAILRRLGAPP